MDLSIFNGIACALLSLCIKIHYMFHIILRIFLDFTSNIVFGLLYRNKSKSLPPISDINLLESATSLAKKIRTKKLKCIDVIESYISRIRQVNPIINAVVDENFVEALREAKKVDQLIESGKKTDKELENEMPLLGVPFTIKDSIAVKGLHQTVGMVSRKDVIADDDSEVVKLLKKAGAINIGNTNVPELTMWFETSNYVYGTTNNPYNTTRICGGSSGGEGSLIAAAGSIIGIGSDLGGSVRLPSFYNGIFGHKPTPGIVSNEGQLPQTVGNVKNFNTTGPLCRYASDLLPMLKIMAGPNVDKLKLNTKVNLTGLRYFYMEDDGGCPYVSKVAPEIKNLLKKVIHYFGSTYGMKTRTADIESLKYSTLIWGVNMAVSGSPPMSELMADGQGKVNIPIEFLKWLLCCSNHTMAAIFMAAAGTLMPNTTSKYYQFYADKTRELEEEFNNMLGKDGVFFYPTQPLPAPYHNQPLLMPFSLGYTAVFNILGLPSTHCCLGLNDDGLPIGIQVVANKYNDHLCLAVAKELEIAFGGWVSPSAIL